MIKHYALFICGLTSSGLLHQHDKPYTHMTLARTNNYAVLFSTVEHAIPWLGQSYFTQFMHVLAWL